MKKIKKVTLKDYILKNYKLEFNEKAPKTLTMVLNNIFASEIELNKFIEYFSLNDCDFLEILSFILDEKNAYNIVKYGYHCYEVNHNYKLPSSETEFTDYDFDNNDLLEDRFVRRIK